MKPVNPSIIPFNAKVIVERDPAESVSRGGIIIPDVAKQKASKGKVVAHGPGKPNAAGERIPLNIPIGATVVWPQHAGTEFEHEGRQLVALEEEYILARLELSATA